MLWAVVDDALLLMTVYAVLAYASARSLDQKRLIYSKHQKKPEKKGTFGCCVDECGCLIRADDRDTDRKLVTLQPARKYVALGCLVRANKTFTSGTHAETPGHILIECTRYRCGRSINNMRE
jgi:hypothetical protein